MHWLKIAIRAVKLGFREYGTYQCATETVIYASVPVSMYDLMEVNFYERTKFVIITLPDLTIEIDGEFETHKVRYEKGNFKTFRGIPELAQAIRTHYMTSGDDHKFTLN